MYEKVVIPSEDKIEIVGRPRPSPDIDKTKFLAYKTNGNLVPEMPLAGEGFRIHTTGLTHDERGYPAVNAEAQSKLIPRLMKKITMNAKDIYMYEEKQMEDAEFVILSYGSTARIAEWTMMKAREKGMKAGFFRLITAWPFPEERVRQIAEKVKGIVTVEINMGQMFYEVERVVGGRCKVTLAANAGGRVHEPEEIIAKVEEILK
jgi:2-oxoglutarate ferredoxin oxidoreductase subunit alpha